MTCIYPRGCVDPIRCGTASRCCATPAPPRYACTYGLGCEGPDCKHEDCPRKAGLAPAFTPANGDKSARDYEHGYNDGVEWAQTHGLTRWIRCAECGAEWSESGDGEIHQHTCSRLPLPPHALPHETGGRT